MALVPFSNQAADTALAEDDLDGDWPSGGSGGGKMSFLEHLDELRKRIVRALLFLIGGFAVCIFFVQQIFDFIMQPMQALLPEGQQQLVYTEPGEAFILKIKMAAIGGLILSSPGITWAVLEGKEAGHSLRGALERLLRTRRRVLPLHGVSADVEVLR
jgi:hypothetical protein